MREMMFDAWSPLDFKRGMARRGTNTAPTWADSHQRRLTAYTILKAYVDNTAREFLEGVTEEERREHREYGDAALLSDQVRAAVMGEDQTIVTDEEDDPDDEWQSWLDDWAQRERFWHKMIEAEDNASTLGDGVYVLGWDGAAGRPTVQVYDPGFYFPVIEPAARPDTFPHKVHVAWEFENEDGEHFVRRITWELRDGEEEWTPAYADGSTTQRCYMSDGVWELRDVKDINDLGEAWVEWMQNSEGTEIRELDIELDFIPVIHLPNTVATQEHFGRSSLSRVLQVLDDLANADTDLQAASATTGTPPISLSGATMNEPLTYKPGQVFGVGDGRMDVLDTSKSLDALLSYVGHMLDRLSTNGRMPGVMMGRVEAGEVPSGVALALTFAPMKNMIGEMRLVRDDKYALLLKMVWRLAVVGGVDGVPDSPVEARVRFGPYMPQDLQGVGTVVAALYGARLISLEVAVQLLAEAGVPSENITDEIERIESRDFDGANELLDATGNNRVVYDYLGIPFPGEGNPVPPTPGGVPNPETEGEG